MDGLMIDSERPKAKLFVDIFASHGIDLDPVYVASTIGRGRADTQRELTRMYPDHDVAAYLHEKTVKTREFFDKNGIPVKPGLFELFDHIEKLGLLKAVATSTSRDRALPLLEEGHIAERLDEMLFGDEITHGKPDPEIFQKTAEKLSAPPERCLVLEDSAHGIYSAHGAGMKVICIPDMRKPAPEALALCEAKYDSLIDVIGYLDAHRND